MYESIAFDSLMLLGLAIYLKLDRKSEKIPLYEIFCFTGASIFGMCYSGLMILSWFMK